MGNPHIVLTVALLVIPKITLLSLEHEKLFTDGEGISNRLRLWSREEPSYQVGTWPAYGDLPQVGLHKAKCRLESKPNVEGSLIEDNAVT